MILDMIKSKELPCCQDRILEDGSELNMQGKKQDLEAKLYMQSTGALELESFICDLVSIQGQVY